MASNKIYAKSFENHAVLYKRKCPACGEMQDNLPLDGKFITANLDDVLSTGSPICWNCTNDLEAHCIKFNN